MKAAGANGLCLARKILGHKRHGRRMLPQVEHQPVKGLGYGGVGPIVTNTVTEAIGPGKAHLAFIAMVVCLPILRMLDHHALDGGADVGTLFRGNPFFLDSGQGEDSLAHGESQFGADFENAEMAADELSQRLRRLIVGGMGLEDNAFVAGDGGNEGQAFSGT